MSLRGVAMLYERIMATRRSAGRFRDHNTHVASIFIGRDIRPPSSPRRTFLPEQKARAPPSRWCQTGCQTAVRFPSSFSFVSSRLLLHVRPREHMFTNNVISTRVHSRKANKPRRSRLRDSTARQIHPRFSTQFILIAFEFRTSLIIYIWKFIIDLDIWNIIFF